MAAESVLVRLPGGVRADGELVTEARVRPLTGADEAVLAEAAAGLPAAERSSAILARCVTIGTGAGDPLEAVRRLTVGDREALLLHIRRLTFGDAFQGILECRDTECGAWMDVTLQISDLLLPPYPDARDWNDLPHGSGLDLQFRVPSGADQEEAASLARTDPEGAATALLRRCVRLRDQSGEVPASLPVEALAEAMACRDPQAELSLDLVCPACGRTTTALFDAGSVLFSEVAARLNRLYREVHTMALSYHWSESDILDLTQPQRLRYLVLLAESAGATV